MPARDAEAATHASPEEATLAARGSAVVSPARDGASRLPLTGLDAVRVLALQRTIGNTAVGRLLQRQETVTEAPPPAAAGYAAWTDTEVRAIQRELVRLRLYNLRVDGDLGPRTAAALGEAFGSDAWQTQTSTEVTEALRAAVEPWAGGGRSLRYSELFRDGVLDVTFGIGFIEGLPEEMTDAISGISTALEERGFTASNRRAAELLDAAGRPLAAASTGRFYVKENAFIYSPPAGLPRQIHVIVRLLHNLTPGGGQASAQAFREAMIHGDAAWYSGHGRYGTGPDFDRNYIEFRLYDANGRLEQTIDDYDTLETVLRRQGDPWTVFRRRIADGSITADLSNAGNIRLAISRSSEFGGRLINWALERTGAAVETGPQGELGTRAAGSAQRYRVLAFYGCSTSAYQTALRDTQGFGTREADVLLTHRTVGGGADVTAFMSFLDGIIGRTSAESILRGVNTAMREREHGYTTAPFSFSGTSDNPGF
jgi:hypothetical protein